MSPNPFFQAWTTPFGAPPFDLIRPEHVPEALDRGMDEHAAEIEAIAAAAPPATFEDTVVAMERSGRLLDRVASVFYNLNASCTSDALEAIARDYAPKLSDHSMRIALDPRLFRRIEDLWARRDALGLAPDEMRLLERRRRGFVRAGAALDDAGKARMAEIARRLATLHTLFGQNVLSDEDAWELVLDQGDLDGLPGFVRDAAAETAAERGRPGTWVVTLSRSSIEPFLTFSARRDLRRQAFAAWTLRGAREGEEDNRPILKEILALRHEQARLLGFATFADYRLDDTMAKTVGAVSGLLEAVWAPAKAKAAAERAELEAEARAAGQNEPVEPWDWRFYAERVRRAKYSVDEAEVKPFFPLDAMIQAAFDCATRLFGVTFRERTDVPVYHPDVRVFEVLDDAGGHVGLFLRDDFARQGKRSGAWMSSYRDREDVDGPVAPIVVNNNNFAKGRPTLLSFDDARTLFHEFGHALHGLLSTARFPTQSGTSVMRDFVEFPSQVFEHWLEAPETLKAYARHHATGAPIPDDLLARLEAARTAGEGFATTEYAAAALLDVALHTHPDPGSIDPDAFERATLERLGMPQGIAVRHRPPHFQHLFAGGGYAAGYYAYLWSAVLDADGFAAFREAGDIFDPRLAAGLKAIYQAGDTEDPMELYRAFRGREPTIDALLNRRGLKAA